MNLQIRKAVFAAVRITSRRNDNLMTNIIAQRSPCGLFHDPEGNIRKGALRRHLQGIQRLNMHDIFALHTSAFEQRTGARE